MELIPFVTFELARVRPSTWADSDVILSAAVNAAMLEVFTVSSAAS